MNASNSPVRVIDSDNESEYDEDRDDEDTDTEDDGATEKDLEYRSEGEEHPEEYKKPRKYNSSVLLVRDSLH